MGILATEGRELAEAGLDLKRLSVSPVFSPALRWGKLRLGKALSWDGLRRAASGLQGICIAHVGQTELIPDGPESRPQGPGQEHHVNVVQGLG